MSRRPCLRAALPVALIAALAACRPSGGEPAPEPASPPPKPAKAVDPPTPAPVSPSMKLPPDRVEMKLPEEDRAGWKAAFEAHIARATVGRSILEKPGILSHLEPLTDPDGRRMPYLFVDRYGTARSINLVHGVAVVEPGAGQAAAERYFADVEPKAHGASRHLVGQILSHVGVLPRDFHPIAHTWALFDERFEEEGLPTPTLTCDDGGCVYTAEAYIEPEGSAGAPEPQHVRLRVRIAPDGALKIERQTL